MTREQILAEITRSLADDFDVDPALVSASARLREDLDLDSIDAVDLSVKMQELTGRRVEESTLRAIRTVGDVVDAVARDLARQESPR
ncbi:MAG: acyl carrier protein [Polyangiales bacterium]